MRSTSGHTFCLDFFALIKGEIGGEKVVPVEDGHGEVEGMCFFDSKSRRPHFEGSPLVDACLEPTWTDSAQGL